MQQARKRSANRRWVFESANTKPDVVFLWLTNGRQYDCVLNQLPIWIMFLRRLSRIESCWKVACRTPMLSTKKSCGKRRHTPERPVPVLEQSGRSRKNRPLPNLWKGYQRIRIAFDENLYPWYQTVQQGIVGRQAGGVPFHAVSRRQTIGKGSNLEELVNELLETINS